MNRIYQEVRTPYKYGMVVAPTDNYHKIDCPTVFRVGEKWLMTYVVYNGKDGLDGRGYETWLASSDDLLHWQTQGRILSYPADTTRWDANQRGGFPALIDWTWGGNYNINRYKGKYWMTYIGGHGTGYEAVREPLNIGLAWTKGDLTQAHEWQTDNRPLLSIHDKDVQWWEKLVQYKSTIYDDPAKTLGKHYVMFYNAGGINPANNLKAERIGIALSNDLKKWKRYDGNPVYFHEAPGIITGDAQIVQMPSSVLGGSATEPPLYVMFYFSAYNPARKYNAYNTFSVSRDLIHWQDWTGDDLIIPSKPYDEMFAHKSYVVKHDGVVYHFYCAVNNDQQRGIAVATSVPMGRSHVRFPEPERKGRRTVTNLNKGWRAVLMPGPECESVGRVVDSLNLPHNFDDYYGYRLLRHGNLHGSAVYQKSFTLHPQEGKRYFLQFEGVGTYATVTLNDTTYPRELVGRTVWTLDVTDALNTGKNTLHVAVDHPAMQTESPWVCGGCSSEWGFSEGSQPLGIFRPVSLIETDAVRIEPFGVHIWNNQACDSVFIDTEVKNYTDAPQQIELVNKFTLASGKQVFRQATALSLQPGETRTLRMAERIENAHRWSLTAPYLYNLATMIKRDGKTTDEVRTPFGIRSVKWQRDVDAAAGFFLNGHRTFINGTCEYEHLLGNSHAFSPEQIRSRVKQIRLAGFNAFREAHQPHNLLYQQLFDEQGMLFWSQFSAHIWYDTPQFREAFKRHLVRWIKERRNSPSVVLWGLQNESVLPRDFAEECCDLIRSLDPTASSMRLITTCNGGEGTDWNVIQNWSGQYGGDPDKYAEELKRPEQLLNGEYGAMRTLGYNEDKFCALMEKKQRLAYSVRDSICGHFQWIFSSHDNPGRTQWDGGYRMADKIGPINHKGLTTIWEQPTEGYYLYKKMRNEENEKMRVSTAADRNRDLLKPAEGYTYICRVNCGGDAYTDTYGQTWRQDGPDVCHSWGDDFQMGHARASQGHITDSIHGTSDPELFRYFRYGRHRLWYDIPVNIDLPHRVELYFAEPWWGKQPATPTEDYEGLRIFDVAINDSLVIDDLDPWAEAGYCGAMKVVVTAQPRNGMLRISFPEVKAGQAVISAIAVALADPQAVTYPHTTAPSSRFWHLLDTDTIAKLPKELLPEDTDGRPAKTYRPTPLPLPVREGSKYSQDKKTAKKHTTPLPHREGKGGGSSFLIETGVGQEYALRFKYRNVTGEAVKARMTITDQKRTVVVDRELTFPPTPNKPNKWKVLSTTTGTAINAGTYTVSIDAGDVTFKELEVQ